MALAGSRIALAATVAAFGFSIAAMLRAETVAPPAVEAASVDQISIDTYSWGRFVHGWTVSADGAVEFRTARQRSANFDDVELIIRRLPPMHDRYRRIDQSLRAAERYAGKTIPCRVEVTDGPYGPVTWRRHGATKSLSVTYACRSKQADAIYDKIGAAASLVEMWDRTTPLEKVIQEVRPTPERGKR